MSQFHSLEANCQTNSRKFHPSIHPSIHLYDHLSGHYITPAQTIQYLRRTNSSRKYQHKFNICLICCAALQCRESFLMTFSWQTVSRLGKFKGQTWHKHTPYIDGTVLGTGPNGKIIGSKNGSCSFVGNIDLYVYTYIMHCKKSYTYIYIYIYIVYI